VIKCHPDIVGQLEDEMMGKESSTYSNLIIELNLMKQMWNISTSDSENTPVVGISTNTTRTGTRTFVDINGILSNAKIPSDGSSKMVGTSAWYESFKLNLHLG
jgi:hypothetical protein